MTTTRRHQPAAATAAVAITGRPGWTGLHTPTDLDLAQQLRVFAWTVLPRRTQAAGGDPDGLTLTRIRSRFPTAEETFGRPALLALTSRPGPGACGFCAAALLAATTGDPRPSPASPVLQALLGRPCRRCQARQRTSDHVAAVRAAAQAEQRLLDLGVPPLAARIGFWAYRLQVPGRIKGEAFADALHPRRPARPARRLTGRITAVGGRR
jgi:hypothetical protein